MGKRTYQVVLYALAFALLLLENALMIFEVRSGWDINPRAAVLLGASMAMAAIIMIRRAPL